MSKLQGLSANKNFIKVHKQQQLHTGNNQHKPRRKKSNGDRKIIGIHIPTGEHQFRQ